MFSFSLVAQPLLMKFLVLCELIRIETRCKLMMVDICNNGIESISEYLGDSFGSVFATSSSMNNHLYLCLWLFENGLSQVKQRP